MSQAPHVIDVTESTFEAEVVERSKTVPVVIDFWAPWCGPCRLIGPVLEKLAARHEGRFILAKVNVEESPRLAQAFQIASIPLVIALKDGQLVDEFQGALSEEEIERFVARLVPSEADLAADEATEMAEVDPVAAEAKLRETLAVDPTSEHALVALASLLLERSGADQEAAEAEASTLLADVAPGGEHESDRARVASILTLRARTRGVAPEDELRARIAREPTNARHRFELGCTLAAQKRYEEALAELLEAATMDRALGRGDVREVMVAIFHTLGTRSELSDSYRAKLARTLY